MALNVTVSPKHIVDSLSDGVTVGFWLTVMVLVSVSVQPSVLVAITVYVAVPVGVKAISWLTV